MNQAVSACLLLAWGRVLHGVTSNLSHGEAPLPSIGQSTQLVGQRLAPVGQDIAQRPVRGLGAATGPILQTQFYLGAHFRDSAVEGQLIT
ncbi:hypothetical protein B0T14DRAFT_502005 [Immersiella caudata]|uniref:Secreted protein n=1 Tax=Immersiella caudata TaxID=314043 RepID=A0AA39XCW5_9PEZI|nr:hypothetical protein B0T14DRAFT_502005 [Immersiella caudata]